jgi:hypothetical protein
MDELEGLLDRLSEEKPRQGTMVVAWQQRTRDAERLAKLAKAGPSDPELVEAIPKIYACLDRTPRLLPSIAPSFFLQLRYMRDGRIGTDEQTDNMINAERQNTRAHFIEVLKAIGKSEILIEVLVYRPLFLHEAAILTLAEIGQPAVPGLARALFDKNKHFQSWAAGALKALIGKSTTTEPLDKMEAQLRECYGALIRGCRHGKEDELAGTGFRLSRLMNRIAEKKDSLAQDRGILLSDMPKPPKNGGVYHEIRRVRNG